jgi:hypothetical protein
MFEYRRPLATWDVADNMADNMRGNPVKPRVNQRGFSPGFTGYQKEGKEGKRKKRKKVIIFSGTSRSR